MSTTDKYRPKNLKVKLGENAGITADFGEPINVVEGTLPARTVIAAIPWLGAFAPLSFRAAIEQTLWEMVTLWNNTHEKEREGVAGLEREAVELRKENAKLSERTALAEYCLAGWKKKFAKVAKGK